jgi:hypothetical protein
MDFVADVLIQAATILGSRGLEEAAQISVREGWDALKDAIKRKFGATSTAVAVLEELPAASVVTNVPAKSGDTAISSLKTRLQTLNLDDDDDLLALAQRLQVIIKAVAPRTSTVYNNNNVSADQIFQGTSFNGPVTFN